MTINASTKNNLIDAICEEMDRVWGEEGLGGEPEQYSWLRANYGITEEEDVQWQLLLQYNMGDLPDEDLEDEELIRFLENDQAVLKFLEDFLDKYRHYSSTYPQS